MARISELRQALASGLQRQHRWQIVFSFPTYAGTGADGEQASLLARTASMPASTLGVIEVNYSGRVLPIAGDRTYEEFTVNFIEVNDHKVRAALEKWSENINGSTSNTGISNLNDYMRDITLNLLDASDKITKTYVLKDAFPSVVGAGDLDQGAMDTYVEFPVTFRYIEYQIAGITR